MSVSRFAFHQHAKSVTARRASHGKKFCSWNLLTIGGTVALAAIVVAVAVSLQNTITPAGIVIHHSAVPPKIVPKLILQEFDDLHKLRGFRAFYWGHVYHVGYHFIILPDGVILTGRPERLRGAHTVGYNNYLGICLVGDFSTRDNPDARMGLMSPSEKQMRALVKLIRYIKAKYQIQDTQIALHRELSTQTECPGDRFDKNDLVQRLATSDDSSHF